MAFNEDSSASGHDEPWIQWFLNLKGHEMFCEIERSYIEDGFNLYGLRACVSNFSDCLDLILDRIGPDEDSDDSQLTQSACTLYGLIHARYIITAHGLDAMYSKYAAKDFGTCPLVQCGAQPVLPVSLKDEMGADTVKIYCPKCSQVYHPPHARSRTGNASGVDGAAFGTTFPHLFLMTFSNLVPDPLPSDSAYVPRVFGFRVHKSARQRFNPPNAALTAPAVALPLSNSTRNEEAMNQLSAEDKKGSLEDDDESKSPLAREANNTSPSIGKISTTDAAAGATSTAGGNTHSATAQPSESGAPSLEEKRARSATKRSRKESSPSTAEGTAKKETNGLAVPTFLMENAVKRRRKNASSNT